MNVLFTSDVLAYRENDEDFYQVRYIANNHTIAQYLG